MRGIPCSFFPWILMLFKTCRLPFLFFRPFLHFSPAPLFFPLPICFCATFVFPFVSLLILALRSTFSMHGPVFRSASFFISFSTVVFIEPVGKFPFFAPVTFLCFWLSHFLPLKSGLPTASLPPLREDNIPRLCFPHLQVGALRFAFFTVLFNSSFLLTVLPFRAPGFGTPKSFFLLHTSPENVCDGSFPMKVNAFWTFFFLEPPTFPEPSPLLISPFPIHFLLLLPFIKRFLPFILQIVFSLADVSVPTVISPLVTFLFPSAN